MATPGPWEWDSYRSIVCLNESVKTGPDEDGEYDYPIVANVMKPERDPNAPFIATFNPQAVLKLIADQERLIKTLEHVHRFFSETLPTNIEKHEPEYQAMIDIRRCLSSLSTKVGGRE